jgi:uncharacterized membrane protein
MSSKVSFNIFCLLVASLFLGSLVTLLDLGSLDLSSLKEMTSPLCG